MLNRYGSGERTDALVRFAGPGLGRPTRLGHVLARCTALKLKPTQVHEPDLSLVGQAEDHDASLRATLSLARRLKGRIAEERRLTATIGIAGNKLLAKISSDHKKPDGLTRIAEADKLAFL
ncbi:MAG: hypothetical protein H7A45_01185 [Verrucomicrobiales bacterium]|nr:hypothetical protein [Verrucomicrobiales bacterium]